MNAEVSFKHLKICLAKRLASVGFVGVGNVVWRKVRDTVVVIDVQKDRKYSTKDEIRFTISLAISVDALRDSVAATDELSSSRDIPPLERCQWRQRLGHLLPTQADTWWSVRDEQTAQSVCEDVAAGLIDVALPKVEAMASSEALLHSWREGRGQGLTEYERRANLAKLLVALGRKDEALAAVRALEEASLGKSWAVSAAYDAKKLKELLG